MSSSQPHSIVYIEATALSGTDGKGFLNDLKALWQHALLPLIESAVSDIVECLIGSRITMICQT
jgi:hypothetical protein